MADLAIAGGSSVPALIALVDRATATLRGARCHAEALEARDIATSVADATKSLIRIAKRKEAADELIAAAYRVQADALDIEAQAKRRLADEYDAAQERGEVARGRPKTSADGGTFQPTAKDIGLRKGEIDEARIIRDAEVAEPGIVRRALDEAIEAGEEPTRAKVKRAVEAKSKRKRHARPTFINPTESQHDRDLRMLLGIWESACESARKEFLQTVNK